MFQYKKFFEQSRFHSSLFDAKQRCPIVKENQSKVSSFELHICLFIVVQLYDFIINGK